MFAQFISCFIYFLLIHLYLCYELFISYNFLLVTLFLFIIYIYCHGKFIKYYTPCCMFGTFTRSVMQYFSPYCMFGTIYSSIKIFLFRDWTLRTKCTWQTVVLLPKRDSKYRGISLFDILWKTVPGLINQRIGEEVRFHNYLHGLKAYQGTGTAPL